MPSHCTRQKAKPATAMKNIILCMKKRRNKKFGEAQGGEANFYYFICISKSYFKLFLIVMGGFFVVVGFGCFSVLFLLTCLHLIFNCRSCYPSGRGFGVRHCHAQPSPDSWWAQSRAGWGGGSSQSPGGPCFDLASPAASCRDACQLQGLEPGRAIPRESPGHL